MKLLRLAAFAALVSLAACTSSPTEPSSTRSTSPVAEGAFSGSQSTSDGGNMLGSGNYSDDGLMDEGTPPVPADTTARGPGMIGSGN